MVSAATLSPSGWIHSIGGRFLVVYSFWRDPCRDSGFVFLAVLASRLAWSSWSRPDQPRGSVDFSYFIAIHSGPLPARQTDQLTRGVMRGEGKALGGAASAPPCHLCSALLCERS